MDMRLEDMRDSEPGFACHLNINLNVSSRIENRSDSFVVVTKQVREFGDAFGLNGFKNERHRDDLTRSGRELQQDRHRHFQLRGAQAASLQSSAALPTTRERCQENLTRCVQRAFRQAAEKHRLGSLCSPE